MKGRRKPGVSGLGLLLESVVSSVLLARGCYILQAVWVPMLL